ncbi:MAG: hypothetical protein IPK93_13435 [Solirubrobacterales bacterium]|nr:hypothetical protein [Solirubrobacterales bacterium]
MFAWTLKTRPEKSSSSGRGFSSMSMRGLGGGASSMIVSRRSSTPKVGQRRAEQDRGGDAFRDRSGVELVTGGTGEG